ncbi:MAG: hypothetical protein H6864_01825 [Micavibrio sp.]|nr:hypothetical protein [Micavibrio sp.]
MALTKQLKRREIEQRIAEGQASPKEIISFQQAELGRLASRIYSEKADPAINQAIGMYARVLADLKDHDFRENAVENLLYYPSISFGHSISDRIITHLIEIVSVDGYEKFCEQRNRLLGDHHDATEELLFQELRGYDIRQGVATDDETYQYELVKLALDNRIPAFRADSIEQQNTLIDAYAHATLNHQNPCVRTTTINSMAALATHPRGSSLRELSGYFVTTFAALASGNDSDVIARVKQEMKMSGSDNYALNSLLLSLCSAY